MEMPTQAGGDDSLAPVAGISGALHHEAASTAWAPSRPTCSQTGLHTRTLATAGHFTAVRPTVASADSARLHTQRAQAACRGCTQACVDDISICVHDFMVHPSLQAYKDFQTARVLPFHEIEVKN